jgi:gamma-polyglutamate biosynthesis protein CapC
VGLTLGGGLLTFLIVHTLSSFLILYGRRRTVMMILVGYMVGMFLRWSMGNFGEKEAIDHQIIGYIIPGLIAIWLERQGIVETLAALLTASIVVRLILILFVGLELPT